MFILGAAATLGGVVGFFYGARQKGVIELLKTENSAYKDSNARLNDENTKLKADCAQSAAEAKMWRDNVTQRPSIEKLIASSNRQHGEYMLKIGELTTVVMTALKELQNGKR